MGSVFQYSLTNQLNFTYISTDPTLKYSIPAEVNAERYDTIMRHDLRFHTKLHLVIYVIM